MSSFSFLFSPSSLTLPPPALGALFQVPRSFQVRPRAIERVSNRTRGGSWFSTMIYKKPFILLLSCDPRACLATGAMGKPQTHKRVPIVKHENQRHHSSYFPFIFPLLPLTLPPRRGVADLFSSDQVRGGRKQVVGVIEGRRLVRR